MTRNEPLESIGLKDTNTVVEIKEADPEGEDLDHVDSDYPDAIPTVQDNVTKSGNNILISKRNFIMERMDVALLMANASQLKAVLVSRDNITHYHMLLSFIAVSMFLQLVFTICMLVKWSFERSLQEQIDTDNIDEISNDKQDVDSKMARDMKSMIKQLDLTGNVLVLVIVFANILITGFGIEADKSGNDFHGLPRHPV